MTNPRSGNSDLIAVTVILLTVAIGSAITSLLDVTVGTHERIMTKVRTAPIEHKMKEAERRFEERMRHVEERLDHNLKRAEQHLDRGMKHIERHVDHVDRRLKNVL
jgi:hypothetical protein